MGSRTTVEKLLRFGPLQVSRVCDTPGVSLSVRFENSKPADLFGIGPSFEAACEDYIKKASGQAITFTDRPGTCICIRPDA